jgi:hypothetical protein
MLGGRVSLYGHGPSLPCCRNSLSKRKYETESASIPTCRPLSSVLECFTFSLSGNLPASLCFYIGRIILRFRGIKFTVIITVYLKLILKLNYGKPVFLNSWTILSSGI